MTSVAIPLAMATVGGFMVVRALHNLYTGQGTCSHVIETSFPLCSTPDVKEHACTPLETAVMLLIVGKGDQ